MVRVRARDDRAGAALPVQHGLVGFHVPAGRVCGEYDHDRGGDAKSVFSGPGGCAERGGDTAVGRGGGGDGEGRVEREVVLCAVFGEFEGGGGGGGGGGGWGEGALMKDMIEYAPFRQEGRRLS